MFKSIRDWLSNLKERFFSEPLKLFDAVVLVVMFGLGLGMEIGNVLGRHWSEAAIIHLTLAVMQVTTQRQQDPRHQLNETVVADQMRKFSPKIFAHILQVIGFEVPVMRLMKMNHDRHDFTH